MRTRVLVLALLLGSSATLAADPSKGPYLSELMNQPSYLSAWKGMLGGQVVPDWIESYAKTLDGPAMPSIQVLVGSDAYTLTFTCKPHDCGGNQLYVLFAPTGRQAWGLLITGEQNRWLGYPDPKIQAAILSGVE
jgi:Inhibitor of vertebrate lysozyme (Ivy)